jgi:hypothetical protein
MYLKKGKNKGVGDFEMVWKIVVKVLIFHASEYLGEKSEISKVEKVVMLLDCIEIHIYFN